MFSSFLFPGVRISSAISSEPPSKSSQGSSYSFIFHSISSSFCLAEFFMVVLHDLIFSSRVHQDFVGGVQVSFLLISKCNYFSVFFWSGVLHFFVLLSYPIISVCGRLSPHNFEMFSISPQQVYSFVVDFLNNSIQSFLLCSFHSILSSSCSFLSMFSRSAA